MKMENIKVKKKNKLDSEKTEYNKLHLILTQHFDL